MVTIRGLLILLLLLSKCSCCFILFFILFFSSYVAMVKNKPGTLKQACPETFRRPASESRSIINSFTSSWCMTLLLLLLLLLLLRLKVPTCLPSAVLAHAVVLDGDEALGWWWGIAKDFGARRLKPFRLLVLRNDDLAAPEELWWHF